ncbi:hypothetical protein KS4_23300 [Poriferisphaera corsica]|uniref:Calcineurin-like phosphoesterase domain-containing protein n=1 Tax=Poriferisphaera corsica TaxID=2528020 RepID=A0A517YVK8_9BACT|nr:hypothetical protein [Poriferisphaera corsica]QDU34263.1 hypothetical protein KS4_23300 [Poriferisphaera corsica]
MGSFKHKWTHDMDAVLLRMKSQKKNFGEISRELSNKLGVDLNRKHTLARFEYLKRQSNKEAATASDAEYATLPETTEFSRFVYIDSPEAIKNPNELLSRADIDLDPNEYEITKVNPKAWTTTMKSEDGGPPLQVQNYGVQIDIRRIPPTDPRAMKQAIIDEIKANTSKPQKIKRKPIPNHATGHMLEICVFDLHLGKYAWKPETGQNYDITIAKQLFEHTLNQIIERSKVHPVSRILFPVGNDLIHIDNPDNTTTRGTRQDVDTRYMHIIKETRQLIVKAINTLREIAPVYVPIIPGNHDKITVMNLGDTLEALFEHHEDVYIDNTPSPRKYHTWEDVLIGFVHGDRRTEINKLPLLMANEAREQWSTARFTEWHCGHLHTRKAVEHVTCDSHNGVVVRTMDSLSGTDNWHAEEGYIGGARAANALVWHPKHGCVAEYIAHAPEEAYA